VFVLRFLTLVVTFLLFNNDKNTIKFFSLASSGIVFVLSCFILFNFDSNSHMIQNYFGFDCISSILFFWLSSFINSSMYFISFGARCVKKNILGIYYC